jgi:hypothetical protein
MSAAVAAAILVTACTATGPAATSTRPSTSPASQSLTSATPPAATEPAGLELLNGRWQVAFKLTSVKPSALRPAADKPSATWDCTVKDGRMTIESGQHTYRGTLTTVTVGEAAGWRYVASAHYTDESGEVWTSDIIVTGTMPQYGAFTADQSGTISSKHGGKLYEATWTAKAKSLP